MVKQCAAPGCTRPPKSRYSKYCNSHSTRVRRHGDTRQTTTFEHHLKGYRAIIAEERRRSRDTGKGAEFWSIMAARWEGLADGARDLYGRFYMGQPMNADDVKAARQIIDVADEATSDEVVDTVVAMYLIAEFEPRRFSCGRGFYYQLARRLRGLAEANCGKFENLWTGKTMRVYRDIPAAVTERFATAVIEALGGGALSFARTIARRAEAKRQETARLIAAAEEIAA